MSLHDCRGTYCARFSPTSMRECEQEGERRHGGHLSEVVTVSVALGREGIILSV